jgi:copper chaperone CopZ
MATNDTSTDARSQTIVLHVEGMTCGHCETHVADALGKLAGVSVLSVSRQDSAATVRVEGAPDEHALVNAVQAAGYHARVARVV